MNQGKQSTRSFGPKSFLARRILALIVLLFSVVLLSAGWSMANAIFTPVNDPISAKVAEWARNHGMGSVVTGLESLQYALNPPKIGGTPGSTLLTGASSRNVQAPLRTIVTPPLLHEGKFKSVAASRGIPFVEVAYLRPDSLHTSYLSAVVWMSGKHTRLELHPGQSDPGKLSLWSQKPRINNSKATGLMAAFNSGFKLKDARGGYFENGHTIGILTPDAASLVVYSNGSTDIGAWGSDVRMTPYVVSVRQNLQLLIENGRLATNLDAAVKANWGTTVGPSTNVWRSGIGITATGDLVYAAGDALSARTLATLLLRAGTVRAMQLDINKSWVSFMWFKARAGTDLLTPHKI